MPASTPPRRISPSERLLDAADELFDSEGVNTVGIDRVLEHAGVAKASLYSHFGSKDGLIRAYLDRKRQRRSDHIEQAIAVHESPIERILAVFDELGDLRGCPFIRAGSEAASGSLIEEVNDAYRAWLRSLLCSLARSAGASDSATLGRQLQMLYDGAAVAGRMDRDPRAAKTARKAAETLLRVATESDGLYLNAKEH